MSESAPGDPVMAAEPDGTVPLDHSGRRMSRRTLLVGAGATVAGMGVSAVGIRGWLNGVWDVGQGAPYELWRSWADQPGLAMVAAAGMLAANPHNLQPWRFTLGTARVELFADPARAMPVNDADRRERLAGFGCAIENMTCAARATGQDAQVELTLDEQDERIAVLTVAPGRPATVSDRRLAAAIPLRHSNRGPYRVQPVDTSTLAAAAEPGVPGVDVIWITDPGRRDALGGLYVDATAAIVEDQAMSTESFSWFRNDRADIDVHRDGLTLDCQGMDPVTLAIAKILPASSREQGDAFWLKTTREVHAATAAAYGIVRVDDNQDPRAQVEGGRLLERLHLAATSLGLGFQHMNQITETIARDRALGRPPRFAARWQDVTGISEANALLAFRVGEPERIANPSPRRALADTMA